MSGRLRQRCLLLGPGCEVYTWSQTQRSERVAPLLVGDDKNEMGVAGCPGEQSLVTYSPSIQVQPSAARTTSITSW